MNKSLITTLLFIVSIFGYSQTIENFLQTDTFLNFDGKKYELVWSSHPNENFYKQEYLTKNQNLDSLKSMLLIDFIQGDFSVEDAVNIQIQEIEKRKKSNPIVNYNVLKKDDETILDFLMSANSADGETVVVVERNVYRYLKVTTKTTTGILLFAVSERAYENEIDTFFKNLNKNKNSLIEKVGNFKIPEINPK